MPNTLKSIPETREVPSEIISYYYPLALANAGLMLNKYMSDNHKSDETKQVVIDHAIDALYEVFGRHIDITELIEARIYVKQFPSKHVHSLLYPKISTNKGIRWHTTQKALNSLQIPNDSSLEDLTILMEKSELKRV